VQFPLVFPDARCAYCKIKVGDCKCGKGYNPVCSFGLTFSTPCDAACGGYTCPMTPGVCKCVPMPCLRPQSHRKLMACRVCSSHAIMHAINH